MNLEQFKIDLAVAVRRGLEQLGKTELIGEKIMVPCRDEEIDVYLYRAKGEGMAPVLFDFHGGGFVYGHGADEDHFCDRIRNDMNIHVISVNYRKAPKYPYPAAVNDTFDTISYFHSHYAEYGINPKKIGVIGHSAGGNLAAVAAIMAKETGAYPVCCQILDYPFLDVASSPFDKPKYPQALPELLIKFFDDLYTKPEERRELHVSPALCSPEKLRGLPPTAIVVAEYDSLREEAEQYAEHLRAAGVSVTLKCIQNIGHGFLEHYFAPGVYDQMPGQQNEILSPNIDAKIAETMQVIESTLKTYLLD